MAKSIDAYLPIKDRNRVLVQAKLPEGLHQSVKNQLETDGLTIQDLIVASLKRYLDERKASKS